MTIDERQERLAGRHEVLAKSLELMRQEEQKLLEASRRDGENIRALVRIAEIRERRLTEFAGGQ